MQHFDIPPSTAPQHRSWIKTIFTALFKLFSGFIILSLLLVLLYRFVPVIYTPLMAIRSIEHTFTAKKNVNFKKDWVALSKINPTLISAVIASEDQLFLQHNGFDIAAIKKAMASNSKKRGSIKGASTISQQTAKNVFLWPHRDWIRKGFEAWFTVLIKLLWSKERIMEVYLNVIEMGDGVYGAQAAAQYYFHKDAARLNRYESASIAAILPNPRHWNAAKPGNYTRQRIFWIQRQMNNLGKIELDK
jgi:monofunctional biosynthetic peptidoglycan transglycosylase